MQRQRISGRQDSVTNSRYVFSLKDVTIVWHPIAHVMFVLECLKLSFLKHVSKRKHSKDRID